MIRLKRLGQKALQTRGLQPVFDLIAFAGGEFVPVRPTKGVRVYSRKGAAKPVLQRVI